MIGLMFISVYLLVIFNNVNLNIIDVLYSLGFNLNVMFLYFSVG